MKQIIYYLILLITLFSNISYSNEQIIKEISEKVSMPIMIEILNDLSGANIVKIGDEEIKFSQRLHKSELNFKAAQYINNLFIKFGYEANFVSVYPSGWVTSLETSYVVKKGSKKPNEVVLFCANFDTPTPPKEKSELDTMPGANNNASGIAIMLEAARILENYEAEKTIVFAAFDDCTNSSFGPVHLIDSLRNIDFSKREYIFLSNLGRQLELNSSTIFSFDTTKISAIVDAFKQADHYLNLQTNIIKVNKGFTVLMSPSTPNLSEITFSNAFRAKDTISNTNMDVFDNLNLQYFSDNAKLAISALAVLAMAKPKGTNISNEFENSTLIYPNPASDYINITLPENMYSNPTLKHGIDNVVENVQIFNMLGVEVIHPVSYAATPQDGNVRIEISHLPVGVYYVRIGDKVEKFVKI